MMCYGENGTVKFLKTLADNAHRHTGNYSMMQTKKKIEQWEKFGLPRPTPLSHISHLLLFTGMSWPERSDTFIVL